MDAYNFFLFYVIDIEGEEGELIKDVGINVLNQLSYKAHANAYNF